MAYVDQRVGRNQRVAVMSAAAVIQGAAIVALIHGFTVSWRALPPPDRTEAEQIKLEPIPTPIPPPPQPQADTKVRPDPLPPLPVPPISGPVYDPVPLPLDPGPIATPHADPIPLPSPAPAFIPRAPKPKNAPGSWATPNDYPARDLREGNQGVTGFSLAVGVDGRVESCTVTRSSGFPGLDKATCDNVSRRARFDAATDGSGARTTGTYSGSIRWRIPQD